MKLPTSKQKVSRLKEILINLAMLNFFIKTNFSHIKKLLK